MKRKLLTERKRKRAAEQSQDLANAVKPRAQKKKVKLVRRRRDIGMFEFRGIKYPVFSGGGPLDGKPFYPLNAADMPLPGPAFVEMAMVLGDPIGMRGKPGTQTWAFEKDEAGFEQIGSNLSELYCTALYSASTFALPMTLHSGDRITMAVVTGHPWSRPAIGPCPCPVMVVGKCLGSEEVFQGRAFVGRTGDLLADTCLSLGIDYAPWYVTNVLKTKSPEEHSGELKKPWVREFLPLLHQELRIVRPNYILCLGADASKTLLGKSATLKSMEGRIVPLTYRVDYAGGRPVTHTALVMCIQHPAAVLRTPDLLEKFTSGLQRFGQLANGNRWDLEEQGLEHFNVRTLDELVQLENRINRECQNNLIAVDAEWHGEHPQNDGSYVRTIQLSWKSKTAACIILRNRGGSLGIHREGNDPCEEDQRTAVKILRRICKARRIAGHYFNADLEWLVHIGLDLREQFSVAPTWLETMARAKDADKPTGGFDTAIACHAVDETGDFALTPMALRLTAAPRYDHVLADWRQNYCHENKLKTEELEGYGECPDEILHPEPDHENPHYACYDADVVWRMVQRLQNKLDVDSFGNNCWEAFWENMRALPGILEMNTVGLPVDRKRLDELTSLYLGVRNRLESEIREWARWPDLNLNSHFQVREFLFGEGLNGKKREGRFGPPVKLRPSGARSLYLEPILTTGKYPARWDQLSDRERIGRVPSTDQTVLGILLKESERVVRFVRGERYVLDLSKHVLRLRDWRFISQIMKQILRPPLKDEKGVVIMKGDHFVYGGGFPAAICKDGRVRSHGYPTKETRRWSFSRPPMQTFAKRREADYKRIAGDDYRWPIRTCIVAPPGWALVEADYKGAELYAMALLSDDEAMIAHAKRNLLPEYHPNFYDIHSSVAVSAFKYDCAPTKSGLESIDKKHMRIVAKSVIFGVAYGRGAKGVALAAKEEGVDISEEEAQQVIDTIFEMYPGLEPFFKSCRKRVSNPGWMCNAFGCFRRFPAIRGDDDKNKNAFEREAMNFPIQALIASLVARAVANIYNYRGDKLNDPDFHGTVDDLYRLALQIHDAVLMLVPIARVPWVVDKVLPECMTNRLPVYPCALDGVPKKCSKPYYLGIDTEVTRHWGEKLSPGECMDMGFDPKYGGWHKTSRGWIDVENRKKIWRKGQFVKPKDKEFSEALQELAEGLK